MNTKLPEVWDLITEDCRTLLKHKVEFTENSPERAWKSFNIAQDLKPKFLALFQWREETAKRRDALPNNICRLDEIVRLTQCTKLPVNVLGNCNILTYYDRDALGKTFYKIYDPQQSQPFAPHNAEDSVKLQDCGKECGVADDSGISMREEVLMDEEEEVEEIVEFEITIPEDDTIPMPSNSEFDAQGNEMDETVGNNDEQKQTQCYNCFGFGPGYKASKCPYRKDKTAEARKLIQQNLNKWRVDKPEEYYDFKLGRLNRSRAKALRRKERN
jgi:hypothetical protein